MPETIVQNLLLHAADGFLHLGQDQLLTEMTGALVVSFEHSGVLHLNICNYSASLEFIPASTTVNRSVIYKLLSRLQNNRSKGFFTLYRFVFEFIAKDECTFARRTPSSFPSFGDSSWPFQGPFVKVPKRNKKKRGPVRKDDVKSFYDFWTTFSSEKSFAYAKPFELDGVPHSSTKR